MKLGKLAKQLRKELAASPGKAALLGVGCLVAAYFWAPLLMPKRKPAAAAIVETAVHAVSTSAAVATSLVTQETAFAAETALRWNEIVRARTADPAMKIETLDSNVRNPFESRMELEPLPPETETSNDETEVAAAEPIAPPAASWNFAQLRIDLRAVSAGTRSRFAQINGLTVEEGEEIDLTGENLTEAVRCLVSEIQSDSVVLEAGGKSYTVRLPERGLPKNAVRLPSATRVTTHTQAG